MSVSHDHYVIMGANIQRLEHEDERLYCQLELYMDDNGFNGLKCLYDGISGQYIIVGIVISCGSEFDGLLFNHISLKELKKIKKQAKELIQQELGLKLKVSLITLSHFH